MNQKLIKLKRNNFIVGDFNIFQQLEENDSIAETVHSFQVHMENSPRIDHTEVNKASLNKLKNRQNMQSMQVYSTVELS